MEDVSIGKGGWVRYASSEWPPTYLRYRPDSRGRLVLHELFIDSNDGPALTAGAIARVPFADLETMINVPENAAYLTNNLTSLTPTGGHPGQPSNVAVLASYFNSTAGTRGGKPLMDNWVQTAQWSLRDDVDTPAVSINSRGTRRQLEVDRDYHLTEQPADGLTDDFLRKVARAYSAAMLRGEAPNKTIAADLGHATSRTVERWVALARSKDRGQIMPAANRKGARG